MSLLDDAINLQQRPGPPCLIQKLAETDPALAGEIREAIEHIGAAVTASAVAKAIAARGVQIAPDTLSRHRRNECVACRS